MLRLLPLLLLAGCTFSATQTVTAKDGSTKTQAVKGAIKIDAISLIMGYFGV